MKDTDDFEIPVHPDDSRNILRLCLHELGHYLVGRELGASPSDITITFTGASRFLGGSAAIMRRSLATIHEISGYLEDRVCILMAGTLCEHLSVDPVTGGVQDCQRWMRETVTAFDREPSSSSDKNKSEELLRTLLLIEVGGSDDELQLNQRMQAISDRIWEKAIGVLAPNAAAILSVGQHMAKRGRFMGVKEAFASKDLERWFTAVAHQSRGSAHSNSDRQQGSLQGDAAVP